MLQIRKNPASAGLLNGGQRGDRTPDTRIFSPLLYQLSYLAGHELGLYITFFLLASVFFVFCEYFFIFFFYFFYLFVFITLFYTNNLHLLYKYLDNLLVLDWHLLLMCHQPKMLPCRFRRFRTAAPNSHPNLRLPSMVCHCYFV